MKDRTRAGRRAVNGLIVGERQADQSRRTRPQNAAPTTNPWYRIQNFIDRPNAAAVYIYDYIGCCCWGDQCTCLTARNFVQELQELKVDVLHVHINSPGGEVDAGVAIYNAIKNHRARTTVHIDGIAASAASFIAMAGDEVLVARNAQVMIHDAIGLEYGNAAELRAFADLLDRYSDNIADIYTQAAGGTVEAWREVMRAETWYTGVEAVAAGLADAVDGQPDEAEEMVAARWDLSVFAYRHAGREKAPAPAIPAAQTEPAPVAINGTPAPAGSVTLTFPSGEALAATVASWGRGLVLNEAPVPVVPENNEADPAAVVVPEVSTVAPDTAVTVDGSPVPAAVEPEPAATEAVPEVVDPAPVEPAAVEPVVEATPAAVEPAPVDVVPEPAAAAEPVATQPEPEPEPAEADPWAALTAGLLTPTPSDPDAVFDALKEGLLR